MTPQERAAAFIKSTFPLHLREDGEPCDGDIEDVVAHDKETRRAALLEAVEFLKLMPMLTKDNAIAVLTRLAQEG